MAWRDRPLEEEPELAIALRYDQGEMDAPRVAAKGRGALAAQIEGIARAHGIPVRRDADLAELLAAIEIDRPIPIAAFAAVAEILAHLYRANPRRREQERS